MVLIESRRVNTDVKLSVNLSSNIIGRSRSVKTLGVTIDSCLSWNLRESALMHRCNGLLIGLASMRYRLPS